MVVNKKPQITLRLLLIKEFEMLYSFTSLKDFKKLSPLNAFKM